MIDNLTIFFPSGYDLLPVCHYMFIRNNILAAAGTKFVINQRWTSKIDIENKLLYDIINEN